MTSLIRLNGFPCEQSAIFLRSKCSELTGGIEFSIIPLDFFRVWSLMYCTHWTDWNIRMTSKNGQCSTRSRCWVSKSLVHDKIVFDSYVLDGIYPTTRLIVCQHIWSIFVIHRAIFSLTTERISTLPIRAIFTYFRTFCLRAYSWQFTNKFQFLFEMMVIDAWSWYYVELLSRFVRFLTESFHLFLAMTLHLIRPREIRRFWKHGNFFISRGGNSLFKHGSVLVNNIFFLLLLSLSFSQANMIMEWCLFSQIRFFEKFSHRINVLFLSGHFDVMHIHK